MKQNKTHSISEVAPGLFQVNNRPGYKPKMNMTNESIDWAKQSWNPVTGCLHGCPYCYARKRAENPFFQIGFPTQFRPTFWPDRLQAPSITKPKDDNHVFVCSMADLFGDWVPGAWIQAVIDACVENPQWQFLFLTKNPKRYGEFKFPGNAWCGATVDTQRRVAVAEEGLAQVKGAAVRFVSCEPLLGPVEFKRMTVIDWVIIGAQSRAGGLPEYQPERSWVDALVLHTKSVGVPIFMKPNLKIEDRIREMPY